jgi:uroporphyrinogen decarboxylase
MECLLLDILQGRPRQEVPVWLMRQAGRYMPEYRELKAVHGFLGLCKNPDLASEITLQPIRRFAPDAAIIFADIMLPAECLGFEISFAPGPVIANPIRTPEQIAELPEQAPVDQVSYVFEAIRRCKAALADYSDTRGRKALLGFAAAPWTMACYLLDQQPFKHFSGTSVFAARHPEAFADFLRKITNLTVEYCRGQIAAGADAIQIFESWASVLSAEDYRKIALPEVHRLIAEVSQHAPVILYANGSSHLLAEMQSTDASALSVDWRTPLSYAAESAPKSVIQGNLDPALLFQTPDQLEKSIATMLKAAPRGRYIANLGHGVLQQTPMEHVAQFVKTIQAFSF